MMNDVQRPFPGCIHHKTAAADVIQWSNWEIRKGRTQWLSLLGLGVGLVVVMFVWLGIRHYGIGTVEGAERWWRLGGVGVLAVFLVGTLGGIVFQVVQLVRRQTIIIRDEQLSFYEVGRWRTYRRHYGQEEVVGLLFGKPGRENGRTAEPQIFLICKAQIGREGQVWHRTLQTRIPLTGWMHTQDQKVLFLLLQDIFEKRKWTIVVEDVSRTGGASPFSLVE